MSSRLQQEPIDVGLFKMLGNGRIPLGGTDGDMARSYLKHLCCATPSNLRRHLLN